MEIKIEKMNVKHLHQIENLLEEHFDRFWTASVIKKELENPLSEYIVAIIDNEVVGYAGIWKPIDEAHITNIVTKKEKRGMNVGTTMLKELIKIAKQESLKDITLEVNVNNEAAINLYKKYNFIECGRRKKYYNNTDDAIIMTLNF